MHTLLELNGRTAARGTAILPRFAPVTTAAARHGRRRPSWRARRAVQGRVRPAVCARTSLTVAGLDGRSRLAPLAPDVGQHGGDLLVGEHRADRRHQPDRALLAVQQDPRRDVGRRERERRSRRGVGASLLLAAAVRLVAGLADVLVDLLPGVEALLLVRRQRRDRRRGAWLARPLDARQHACRRASPGRRPRRASADERRRLAASTAAARAAAGRRSAAPAETRTRRPGPRVRPDRSGTARPAPAPALRRAGRAASRHRRARAARPPRRAAAPTAARPAGSRRAIAAEQRSEPSPSCAAADERRGEHRDRRLALRRLRRRSSCSSRSSTAGSLPRRPLSAASSAIGSSPWRSSSVATARLARARRQRAERRRQLLPHGPVRDRPAASAPRPGPGCSARASQRSEMRIADARTSRDGSSSAVVTSRRLDRVQAVERPQRVQPRPPVLRRRPRASSARARP